MMAALRSRTVASLAWWKRALQAGLPQGLAAKLEGQRLELRCTEPPSAFLVRGRVQNAVDPGRLSARAFRNAFIVPPEVLVLRRTVRLPAAALADLVAVIRLDIPVSTPFDVGEVYFAARPGGRSADHKFDVNVAIVQKATLAPWLTRFEDAGGRPQRLWLGPRLIADIDPARAEQRSAAVRLDWLLAGLAGALGLTVFVMAQVNLEAQVRGARADLSANLAAIEQARQLETRIETAKQRLAFLPSRRKEAGSTLALFGATGTALPEELRVVSLSVHGADVTAGVASRAGPPAPDAVQRFAQTLFQKGFAIKTDKSGVIATVSGRLPGQGGTTP